MIERTNAEIAAEAIKLMTYDEMMEIAVHIRDCAIDARDDAGGEDLPRWDYWANALNSWADATLEDNTNEPE